MYRLGLIGWPVGHSLSQKIHAFWLDEHGLAGSYTPLPCPPDTDIAQKIDELRRIGYCGINVTIPHKTIAYQAATAPDACAQRLEAANILHFRDEHVFASNSDGYGFMKNLDAHICRDNWNTAPVLVLGAGGAARAVAVALADAGVGCLRLTNRTHQHAVALAALVGAPRQNKCKTKIYDWSMRMDAVKNCRLVINTTRIGMGDGETPLSASSLTTMAGGAVVDIVYTPRDTPLLQEARACGLVAIDGLGMLLHQAVPAFALWTGVRPIVSDMLFRHVVKHLEG